MLVILPWIAFALGLWWIVRQGDKAKQAYKARVRAQQEQPTAQQTTEQRPPGQPGEADGGALRAFGTQVPIISTQRK